jgi:hypothetical protein
MYISAYDIDIALIVFGSVCGLLLLAQGLFR